LGCAGQAPKKKVGGRGTRNRNALIISTGTTEFRDTLSDPEKKKKKKQKKR